jgi:deoxyribodipyrimidine photolyase-related protein
VLGDQLTPTVAALRAADRERDVVVMAEVMEEASYVPHHPKKIALFFAAMRKFAARLEADGWRVLYTRLDDEGNAGSIPGELLRRAGETGAREVIATEPGEWRLIARLGEMPLPVTMLEDDRFLASHADFEAWAEGRKQLRMEWFYREMRRRTGLLMEGDQPAGGQWNFDHDNRKPASDDLLRTPPLSEAPDATVEEVLALVEARFGGNFGRLRPFGFATDAEGAERALEHFLSHHLADFGTYQDAMLVSDRYLNHAVISAYMNLGLSGPARGLPPGRGGMAGGPGAAQFGRGLHPPDHRLARVHARHLFSRRPRLHRAQRAGA